MLMQVENPMGKRNYNRTAPSPKVTPLVLKAIIQAARDGEQKKVIARDFNISREWLYRLLREHAPETIGDPK